MSFPALQAIRERFSEAKITLAVGKSCVSILEMAEFFDEKIVVDRVKLRDGARIESIKQIFKIIGDVRKRKFDFVIDLHSLSETNLLGFLSGANYRLYANRENRSLDFLANFKPKPPLENKAMHMTDRYLDVLKSLGIENQTRFVNIRPRQIDIETIEKLWQENGLADKKIVGLNLGAGHPSRCWNLDNFAELAAKISNLKDLQTIVFLGPEERDLIPEIKEKFPAGIPIFDKLKLPELAAAFARLDVLIGNDTGPIHLGAVVGAPIVLILDNRAPTIFLPLTETIRVVNNGTIDEITVENVYSAMRELF